MTTTFISSDNEAIKKYLDGVKFWIKVDLKTRFCIFFKTRVIARRGFNVFTSWQLFKDGATKVSLQVNYVEFYVEIDSWKIDILENIHIK